MLRQLTNITIDKAIRFATDANYREFHRLLKMEGKEGTTTLLGEHKLTFVDGLACARQHLVIFKEGLYAMKCGKSPRIIDAGANIGMASLYFKKNFPDARITAFEPDPRIAEVLRKNLRSFRHDDVEVIRGAVSDHNGTMNFAPDHADGGRLAPNGQEEVKVVRMRDWLNEPIDLLKLDIEGAEFDVIKDCDDRLSIVKCLFVEYHSFASQRQRLPELFAMLRDGGFRVHVQTDYCAASPLLDPIIDNGMDLRLNIFGSRPDTAQRREE
jgi:FkbM family methyltransferase